MANYGVYRELRWFSPWKQLRSVITQGHVVDALWTRCGHVVDALWTCRKDVGVPFCVALCDLRLRGGLSPRQNMFTLNVVYCTAKI